MLIITEMKIITIAILAFTILEALNVIILYFVPTSKKGNGVGVFNAFEKSKEIPEVHAFIKYLINWIAGTKLIFMLLLLVIIYQGDTTTQYLSAVALIISIASFYWRLYPIIKQMDNNGELNPKGYSKTLAIMISGFILVFIIALLLGLFVPFPL